MDKQNIVEEWVRFSKNDLETAEYLLGMRPLPLEIICYHCQQSVEKILKAYLLCGKADMPKTHDLNLLRNLCAAEEPAFSEIEAPCARLNPYGVQPRYPFGLEILESDMENALLDAQGIYALVKEKLNV
jgi:HEPN domain-containing protein